MKIHKPRTYFRMVKRGLFGKQTMWEPKVWKVAKQVYGRVFLDVGACEGLYTLGLQKHFKAVYAYEPNPEFYERLRIRIGKRSNIFLYPYAISDKDGKATLFLDDTPGRCNGSADTILPVFDYAPASMPNVHKKTYLGDGKGIAVETRSLDSLFPTPSIDLLKVDVEGAEFLVLYGARRMIEGNRLQNAIIELHNRDRKEELVEIFRKNDYSGKWLDPDHYYAWVPEEITSRDMILSDLEG